MESITDTTWDVLIAGTGLPQSLLALALSRSNKKVLHVDKNEYYGGADAALTLQDAEAWVQRVNTQGTLPYRNACIVKSREPRDAQLGFSRSYSLALSPQIIYTRSALLPALVSSKVFRQLEFLAVGSWFVYSQPAPDGEALLRKIPNSREDVFADNSLDLKSKRALISFLRSIRDSEEQSNMLEEHGSKSLLDFLSSRYKLTESLTSAVNALTLSPDPASETKVSFALPRVARHLASIGVFGPGFSAVIPKWGGLAEITQVACRAQAVGGGTYMLGKGIHSMEIGSGEVPVSARLDTSTVVSSRSVCGRSSDLPDNQDHASHEAYSTQAIAVVAASLDELFIGGSEGGPKPNVAIVCFSAESLQGSGQTSEHPTYLMIHSSDTGECPTGQCVVYASVKEHGNHAQAILTEAIEKLLVVCHARDMQPLWTMHFERFPQKDSDASSSAEVHAFNDTSPDLAFNDEVLQQVRVTWQSLTGQEDGFMEFEDREVGAYEDDED